MLVTKAFVAVLLVARVRATALLSCTFMYRTRAYTDGSAWDTTKAGAAAPRTPWPATLLAKSASVRGFFLNDFAEHWPEHMMRLWGMVEAGTLVPGVDPTHFDGLEGVADAIDFMYDRKNVGKLVVKLAEPTPSADAKL